VPQPPRNPGSARSVKVVTGVVRTDRASLRRSHRAIGGKWGGVVLRKWVPLFRPHRLNGSTRAAAPSADRDGLPPLKPRQTMATPGTLRGSVGWEQRECYRKRATQAPLRGSQGPPRDQGGAKRQPAEHHGHDAAGCAPKCDRMRFRACAASPECITRRYPRSRARPERPGEQAQEPCGNFDAARSVAEHVFHRVMTGGTIAARSSERHRSRATRQPASPGRKRSGTTDRWVAVWDCAIG